MDARVLHVTARTFVGWAKWAEGERKARIGGLYSLSTFPPPSFRSFLLDFFPKNPGQGRDLFPLWPSREGTRCGTVCLGPAGTTMPLKIPFSPTKFLFLFYSDRLFFLIFRKPSFAIVPHPILLSLPLPLSQWIRNGRFLSSPKNMLMHACAHTNSDEFSSEKPRTCPVKWRGSRISAVPGKFLWPLRQSSFPLHRFRFRYINAHHKSWSRPCSMNNRVCRNCIWDRFFENFLQEYGNVREHYPRIEQIRRRCWNVSYYYFIIQGQHCVGVHRGRKCNARVCSSKGRRPHRCKERILGIELSSGRLHGYRLVTLPKQLLLEYFHRLTVNRKKKNRKLD